MLGKFCLVIFAINLGLNIYTKDFSACAGWFCAILVQAQLMRYDNG